MIDKIDVQTRLKLSKFISIKDIQELSHRFAVSKATIERLYYGRTYITKRNYDIYNAIVELAKENCLKHSKELKKVPEIQLVNEGYGVKSLVEKSGVHP
jgi:hypothetical protein